MKKIVHPKPSLVIKPFPSRNKEKTQQNLFNQKNATKNKQDSSKLIGLSGKKQITQNELARDIRLYTNE